MELATISPQGVTQSQAEQAKLMLKTASTGLNSIKDIINEQDAIIKMAHSLLHNLEEKTSYQQKLAKLTKNIDYIATTTSFNSKNLLDGSISGSRQVETDIIGSLIDNGPSSIKINFCR